jgi:DNA integrity scanning protein DisA with diadenylate cyclase activity
MADFLFILIFFAISSWVLFLFFLFYQLKLKGLSNIEKAPLQFQSQPFINYFKTFQNKIRNFKKNKNKSDFENLKKEQEKKFRNDRYWQEIKEMFKGKK